MSMTQDLSILETIASIVVQPTTLFVRSSAEAGT
jgi:hypothetical protein